MTVKTTQPQSTTEPTLEPCPLSHYVHAGLRAHKTGLDPRIVCLDCGLTLRAPDWIKVYERWQSRPAQNKHYFCSCGAACTAEEYIKHFSELGHDQGEGKPRVSASVAPTVDHRFINAFKDAAIKAHMGFSHAWAWEECKWIECEDRRKMIESLLTAASTVAPVEQSDQLTINGAVHDVHPDVAEVVNGMLDAVEDVADTHLTMSEEIVKTLDDALMRVGASANCYDSPADAQSGAEYVAMRVRQVIAPQGKDAECSMPCGQD